MKKGEYIYPPLFYALICRGSYDEGIDTYMPELCPLLYQHNASIRFHTPHSRHHGNLHPHAGNDVRKHTAGYNSAWIICQKGWYRPQISVVRSFYCLIVLLRASIPPSKTIYGICECKYTLFKSKSKTNGYFSYFSVFFLQLFDIYRARFCNNLVNQLKQQTYFF